MKDDEMLEILKGLESGAKIKITIKCIGGTCELEGIYKGVLQKNGYYKKTGGWGLYKTDDDEIPCWQFYFREKGKRSIYIMQIGYKVIDIRIEG